MAVHPESVSASWPAPDYRLECTSIVNTVAGGALTPALCVAAMSESSPGIPLLAAERLPIDKQCCPLLSSPPLSLPPLENPVLLVSSGEFLWGKNTFFKGIILFIS